MGRSDDIPDRYENHHRPEEPSVLAIIIDPIAYVILGQAFVLSICFFVWAYSNIRFGETGRIEFEATKSAWCWMTGISVVISFLATVSTYVGGRGNCQAYEAGYRAWQAEQERHRVLAQEASNQEAERQRLVRLQRERDRDVAARRQRIADLEAMVLRAHAQHVVEVDFLGTKDRATLLAGFRSQLAKLAVGDLGLLRETQNQAVRSLIGDGSALPPAPPFQARL